MHLCSKLSGCRLLAVNVGTVVGRLHRCSVDRIDCQFAPFTDLTSPQSGVQRPCPVQPIAVWRTIEFLRYLVRI
jgi:hypothetical protein